MYLMWTQALVCQFYMKENFLATPLVTLLALIFIQEGFIKQIADLKNDLSVWFHLLNRNKTALASFSIVVL